MPKILKNKDEGDHKASKRNSMRHDPLARPTLLAQIDGDEIKVPQPRGNRKKKMKKRIYEKSKRSAADEQEEVDDNFEDIADDSVVRQAHLQAKDLREEESGGINDADQDDDLEYDSDDAQSTYSAKSGVDDYEQYLKEEQLITAEEEEAFNSFLDPKAVKVKTIADLIEEKLQQKRQATGRTDDVAMSDEDEGQLDELDPKVISVYQGVGKLLTRYKSGKLPKALKIAPNLVNWEQIIGITNPPAWSNNAFYACTRIFASCLQDAMAQRFYNLVLLPRIVEDLKYNKRLNYHLYQSLKKALYKPAAFYKGIVLPLCESGGCTLREATVLSSVIKKVSVPVLHSSAALLKLSLMKYTGAQSIFMRELLDKKYALPYRVIDGVVEHFGRFREEQRELPVKWHQSLLVLVQRYKKDLSPPQRQVLKEVTPTVLSLLEDPMCLSLLLNEVMRVHGHYCITPEIRRELFSVPPPPAEGASLSGRREETSRMLGAMAL